MKKKITAYLAYAAILCTIIYYGCKKIEAATSASTLVDNATIKIAKDWMLAQKVSAKFNEQSAIDTALSLSDWSNGVIRSINTSTDLIYIPLKIKDKTIGISFKVNRAQQKIDSGNLVAVSFKTVQTNITPDMAVFNQYSKGANSFTGTVTKYSITNNFQIEFGFDKGKLRSEKIIKPYRYPQQTSVVKVNRVDQHKSNIVWNPDCYYTFYVTTDYATNMETWTLMGWWCPGDCQDTGGIQFSTGTLLNKRANCGGGEPGGIPAPPADNASACSMEQSDAQSAWDNSTYDVSSYALPGTADGAAETGVDGIVKQNYNAKTHIYTFSSLGFTMDYAAVYTARRYKDFEAMTYWKWYEKPVFSNTYLHDGGLPPCAEISISIIPTDCVVSSDEKSATATYLLQFQSKFTCKVGWVVGSFSQNASAPVLPHE